jgi:predicted nucleic acid-binding protein
VSVAVDTNVLVVLLPGLPEMERRVGDALQSLSTRGAVEISPVVYPELLARRARTTNEVDDLLALMRVQVSWDLEKAVWINAGQVFASYTTRRRDSGGGIPRRLLADFLNGAHAQLIGDLLTFDLEFYRISSPMLRVPAP